MAKRTQIPARTQARVQFESDRTCCVCRVPGKPIQIHHIDENNANHDILNLAVLCRDCHDQTMVRGTFNRTLDGDTVTLFRDDWLKVVASKRAPAGQGNREKDGKISDSLLEKLEIFKEQKKYFFLALEYSHTGNTALRDKYIELAIKQDSSDMNIIFLRSLQGQSKKIPRDVVQRVTKKQAKNEEWSQLARTFAEVGEYKGAALNYCRSVVASIEDGNIFSAAFYLKELSEKNLFLPLFEETYEKYKKAGDIWWTLRSLQERGWWKEARQLLSTHKKAILKARDILLLRELYAALGDMDSVKKIELEEAREIDHGEGVVFRKKNTSKTHSS